MTKMCTGCRIEQELSCFYKNRAQPDGLQSTCKQCARAYKVKNAEKIAQQQKEYYQRELAALTAYKQQYYIDNAERMKEQQKEYVKTPEGKRFKRDSNLRYLLKLNLATAGRVTARTLNAWAAQVKDKTPFCNWCYTDDNLHAHHILHKCKFPQHALEIWNGLTLCEDCHIIAHKQEGK